MPNAPVHRWVPVRWSLRGLRQIAGQEIRHVTGDGSWADAAPGTWPAWWRLARLADRYSRIAVWRGPWLLLSDPAVWDTALRATCDGQLDVGPLTEAVRAAAWFARGLLWGYAVGEETLALWAFLEQIAWPPDWWRRWDRVPALPWPEDWTRLEKRIWYLRAAIMGARAGQSRVPWGIGTIDCRPLLLPAGERGTDRNV